MAIPTELNRKKPIWIPSPYEEQKIRNAKQCTQEGVKAGAKAASIACVASAVPTFFKHAGAVGAPLYVYGLISVRVFPWAKRNLNYTAQALIISAASIAAYFITADKTILECARRNSMAGYDKSS